MSAWESTRTPSLRKLASCSIIALRNSSESPILSSSATMYSFWIDWSLPKEPHGGRPRQQLRLLHTPRDSTLEYRKVTTRCGGGGEICAVLHMLRFPLQFLHGTQAGGECHISSTFCFAVAVSSS